MFPSQEEMREIFLERRYRAVFPEGDETRCSTSTFLFQGERFFLKMQPNQYERMEVEELAYLLGCEVGVEKFLVPLKYYEIETYKMGVSPYLEEYSSFYAEPAAAYRAVSALSEEEYSLIHFYHFLIGDIDRHGGNYLVNPTTNTLKMIDWGAGLNSYFDGRNQRSYMPEKGHSNYGDYWILDYYRSRVVKREADAIPLSWKALDKVIRILDASMLIPTSTLFRDQKIQYAERFMALVELWKRGQDVTVYAIKEELAWS